MRTFEGVFLVIIVVFVLVFASCNSSGNKENNSSKAHKATEINKAGQKLDLSHKAQTGKKVFDSNGCFACHQNNQKLVGPALVDIAAVYSGNRDHLVEFFEGKRKSIIDPSQEVLMRSALELTKKMPQAEREALVDYILAHQ